MSWPVAPPKPLFGTNGKVIGPGGRKLIAEIGSIIAALCRQIIRVLRFQIFVFLGLTDRVLPSVRIQHAPICRESLFELDLQSMRNGPGAIGERADFSDIRHRVVVEPSEIRGRTGCTRWIGRGGAGFEVAVQWSSWLIAIAEKAKLDAACPDICDLERHSVGDRPLYVQIPLFNIGGAVIE